MKWIKGLGYSLIGIFLMCALGTYTFFLHSLPKIANTPETTSKLEKLLSSKIGLPIELEGSSLKTKPNLTIIYKLKKLSSTKDNISLGNFDDIEYRVNLLNPHHGFLSIKDFSLDLPEIKKRLQFGEKEETKPLNLSYIPFINIDKGYVKLEDNSYMNIKQIKSKKLHNNLITTINAAVKIPYAKSEIIVGEQGDLRYKSGKWVLENFSIKLDNSTLYLSSKNSDIFIKGNKLPISELEHSFIYFYKLKHPNKRNFIENFTDFQGLLDVDLAYNTKDGFSGSCTATNLGAKFSNFKIPMKLPKTDFKFKGKEIIAKTSGTFGADPVQTDFHLSGIGTKDLKISGNVSSPLTNKTTKPYYPEIGIIGKANADVKYNTHNGKVDVFYTLTLNKGSDLETDYGNIGNTNVVRKITMHTIKQGDPMEIKDYDFSVLTPSGWEKYFKGNGLFEKQNGHYKLSFLTLKTNGEVPVATISPFLKNYITNGTFNADLRFDAKTKALLGAMNLYNIRHSDNVFLKTTHAKVDKNLILLKSEGTFYGSPISASASASNDFSDNIIIRNIDVYLNSFYVQRGKLETSNIKTKTSTNINKRKIKNIISDVIVEKGNVKVDRIYGSKFDVKNVSIQGTLKNNVANFIIPQAEYAKGILSAKGVYNLSQYSSDIQFFASDIDSNEVVTNFFKLPNQVEGDAFATLHVITKNKLNDIKAKATFAIADGFLPTIGSQEFMINGSKTKKKKKLPKLLSKINFKFTLSKISNIDFSKRNSFYSNLYGSFNIDNEQVQDAKIFSKSDFLSFFIEGNYDIDNEYGDLALWGKRNKTEAKKIRIFKIPLNLIYKIVFKPEKTKDMYQDKIFQIPDIKIKIGDDISTFRVSVCGNLNNSNKLKVELKDIR